MTRIKDGLLGIQRFFLERSCNSSGSVTFENKQLPSKAHTQGTSSVQWDCGIKIVPELLYYLKDLHEE